MQYARSRRDVAAAFEQGWLVLKIRRSSGTTAVALALALTVGYVSLPARGAASVAGDPAGCGWYLALDEKLVLSADGKLSIPPLPTWTMPGNPTWRENPFHDPYWLIRYQSLRYLDHLIADWCRGAAAAELDRARFLMTDWLADNPKGAAGPYAWYDHAVAWRTFVLIHAAAVMPFESWIRPAVSSHGTWLAGHSGGTGNHALNTNRGLLAAGCFLDRQDWIDLAVRNIEALLKVSVDDQGITNEQAVAYQDYNFRIYSEARKELLACGQPESTYFQRITLMPRMLAYATLPNGEYEMLGDTPRLRAPGVAGTWAEYAATFGASGPKPPSTDAIYRRGFAFIRSGWGEAVPWRDEIALTARFGAGRRFHGHDDGGAITLYGFGSRLLFDSGKDTFQGTKPWSPFFLGRRSHNVVTVDGLAYTKTTTTTMQSNLGAKSAVLLFQNAGYYGVSNTRSVVYARARRFVIVDDRLKSSTSHTYRQLWHLAENSNPYINGRLITTRGPLGNVGILQLTGGTTRIRSGGYDPVQGWLTYDYQKVIAAPTVERAITGTSVRYLTILVPFRDKISLSGQIVALYTDGYTVDVTMNGKTERWTLHGTTATVTDVTATSASLYAPATAGYHVVFGALIAT